MASAASAASEQASTRWPAAVTVAAQKTALFASKKTPQTPRPGSSNAPEPSETGAAIALVANAARAAASDPPSPIVPILPTVMARPGISGLA